MRWLIPLLALVAACDKPQEPLDTASPGWDDADGDGYDERSDCDDADPAVHPGAAETCDGVDDDCDGFVDGDDPDLTDGDEFYADADADGYGDAAAVVIACDQPEGAVPDATDCDDGDAGVNPGAAEVCDGVDQDCDGEVDEDAVDPGAWYADADGDGYGDAGASVAACAQPTGTVADDTDCDDAEPGVNPGAAEVCDGVDQDCDGEVDEDALDAATWYADADSDGYGDAGAVVAACAQPTGTVADDTDCDDTEPGVNPGVAEVCDGVDQDCDGEVDEEALDAATWYADADSDGYGDAGAAVAACAQPTGTVADDTDCDDAEPGVNPGAAEVCDGVDQDCDGDVDEAAVDMGTWYADADGDGYGDDATATMACTWPTGTVSTAGDCDDGEPGVNPGAAEVCDGVDQDCDGDVDEEATDAGTWYADADGDSYGDPGAAVSACTQPSGTVSDATDCDDADASAHPGATEYCDGVDTDCDGSLDPASTVTFISAAGVPRDVTSDFTLGPSGTAAAWSFSSDGTLAFCAGSYQRTISVTAASAAIVGYDGSAVTTLSGGAGGSVILASTGAADLEVSGLTLTQGYGTNGGGVSSAVSGLEFTAVDLAVTYSAATNGGGLYFDNATSVTLEQVAISYCGATKGGGLYMDHGVLDFDDLTVEYCAASSQGGGLYLKHLDATGSDLLASNDIASSKGGGLYVEDTTLALSDAEVSANRCSDKGGGLNVKGNSVLDLTDTLVADNQAVTGGGLYLESSAGTCTGTTTAADYEGFVRNLATLGGALYVKGSSATWNASTCDLGTGSDDNALYDAYVETGALGYSWADDAIFACSATSCR
ncbi:MAG: MopE-related protein [Pseudomonadota bacterium]